MNPEDSLDLRSLADVESPAVVQGALRRFRRKIFTTGALVLLSFLCLAGGIIVATVLHKTLDERIETAAGWEPGAVYSTEEVTLVLRRVVRLNEGLGLHFLLAAPASRGSTTHFLRTEGIRDGEVRGAPKTKDMYLVVEPPEAGLIDMRLLERHGCDAPPGGGLCRSKPNLVFSFEIDLADLGVPENIWSNGG